MLFLACFKVGRYLVPKITLFYTLKYKYFINHGLTTNPNKVGFDGTMIVEECLGTSDGAARSPRLVPRCRRRCRLSATAAAAAAAAALLPAAVIMKLMQGGSRRTDEERIRTREEEEEKWRRSSAV